LAARGGSAELLIEGVGKRFGDVVALDHVSLSVAQGELLTILGPSGSGKTTLLKVVAGFETPDGGTVKVGGTDISALPPARRDIGMVFQNYALFPHLSVKANVAFPLEMRNVAKPETERRVAEALAMVELAGYEARLPKQLSGGHGAGLHGSDGEYRSDNRAGEGRGQLPPGPHRGRRDGRA